MKNYLRAVFVLLAASLLSTKATAADSQFNVEGTVIAFPCQVDPESVDKSVDLGKMSTSGLAEAGSAHTWRAFMLKVIHCPAVPGKKLTIRFQGTPAGSANNLYANSGSAQNVAIQMAQQSDTSIIQGDGSSMTVNVNDDGSATFPMVARIYSEKGGATQGSIESQVQFNFTYQ